MAHVNLWIAFWAGIVSFISPCILPLYPSYISYITGLSFSMLKNESHTKQVRLRILFHTLFFIAGFSVIFYSLGLGAGVIGDLFHEYKDIVRRLAGIFLVLMGLVLIGILQPSFLMKERKLKLSFKNTGYLGSFLLGIGFAAGWSPCIGPILTAIVAMASAEPGAWFGLITAYTAGFAIPFLAFAFFIGSTNWIKRYSMPITRIGGAFMIFIGILLFTGEMTKITIFLTKITPDWLKF